jgi:hypothetical protein
MTGDAIVIDNATATDTIRSVKQRVFAASCELPECLQRLVYRAGRRGIDALADSETLGGAGVAEDGTAELDVLLSAVPPMGGMQKYCTELQTIFKKQILPNFAQTHHHVWYCTVLHGSQETLRKN